MAQTKTQSKSSVRVSPAAAGPSGRMRGRWMAGAILALVLGGGLLAYVKFGPGFGPGKSGSPEVPARTAATNWPRADGSLMTEADGRASATHSGAEFPTDPVELLKIGNDFLNQGQPGKAIPYYHRAVELNSEDEEIHFNLGFAYSRIGYTNDAIHHYRESLRIYPEYVEAHNNLGNIYVSLSQHGKAIEHFTSALNTMPDHASALNNLGKCLAAQGKLDESVNQFSQALRIDPDYFEARYNLGQAFLGLKKFDEAMVEFGEALRLRPDFRPAAAGLARARDLKSREPK